jgi:outer membrane receptor for ferrienterochelin and colicins
MKLILPLILIFIPFILLGQNNFIKGRVMNDSVPVPLASVFIKKTQKQVYTDSQGYFIIEHNNSRIIHLVVNCIGFHQQEISIHPENYKKSYVTIQMKENIETLGEFVVTGTMRATKQTSSPIVVETFNQAFLKKNPSPNLFEALQNVNGVRPQINCSVCNTGDIHINGLEGPYTMILIDGMPIVSSLASVYGLSGIPNSMIERVEIVKGPASSLYGSEAIGGLINVITKRPQYAPLIAFNSMVTSWNEINNDLSIKLKISPKVAVLTGINYFNNSKIYDKNKDNFTDIALQTRLSVFQKYNFERKKNKLFSVGLRFLNEDRWGGETQWTKAFRGGDSLYGENIITKRFEWIGAYQLPIKENIQIQSSYTSHYQNSVYGNVEYVADQKLFFIQSIWTKSVRKNDWLAGIAYKNIRYNDNLISQTLPDSILNNPSGTVPGLFIQYERKQNERHRFLLGMRFDYYRLHGPIFTPRIAYKYNFNPSTIFRLNAGTGFRVVNLMTEEHALMTGARTIQINNQLKPEQSVNSTASLSKSFRLSEYNLMNIETSLFYNHFYNRILPDYDQDPNKIIIDNIQGYFYTAGWSLSSTIQLKNGLRSEIGWTAIDIKSVNGNERIRPILTENFSATWSISYPFKKLKTTIDYTGNLYSPMRLPVLNELDPRKAESPWWSIQNIQISYNGFKKIKCYGGVKNFLNYTPNRGNPFIIARANDPFDKQVTFNSNGEAVSSANNPHALTFDPSYIFAPNQGIRFFVGFRIDID